MPLPNIGVPELVVILVIALLLLGPGKLPEVAQSLGRSVREFRRAASDVAEAGKLEPTTTNRDATSQAPSTAPAAAPAPPPSETAPEAAPARTGEAVAAGTSASDRDSSAG